MLPAEQQAFSHEAIMRSIAFEDEGRAWARFGALRLFSHFQPIVSLTHARIVGHEGLMRALADDGAWVPPPVLLAQARDTGTLVHLDRLSRAVHVLNAGDQGKGWLFLNMHPEVFVRAAELDSGAFLGALLEQTQRPMRHLVIEVLEESIRSSSRLTEAVAYFRSLGCLVALDDFGAGHSNFDRIWQLSPEIVKLDRSFALQAEQEIKVRRLLPRIAALLHETGALVLLEGVETETQAMIALEANIDLAQGYWFGRPQELTLPIHQPSEATERLWQQHELMLHEKQREQRRKLDPYERAIDLGAAMLAGDLPISEACREFLELPNAEVCYLLDAEGRQVGENLWRSDWCHIDRRRFSPMSGANGARWSRRPYFRHALEHFGRVQVTQPYLSSASGCLCVTVSISLSIDCQIHVLCGDIRWE